MVGTIDEHSSNDWRSLQVEHAYAAKLPNSNEQRADALVRQFMELGGYDDNGRLRYRVWLDTTSPGVPDPYDGRFWRSERGLGIRCDIYAKSSSACWTGPASPPWRLFGEPIAKCRVRRIDINHNAFVEFLRSVGILPVVVPETEAVAEPEVRSESELAVDELSEFTSSTAPPVALQTASPEPSTAPLAKSEANRKPEPPVDPFRSGSPGPPTARHLVFAEARRRIADGEVIPEIGGSKKFADELAAWWGAERLNFNPVGPTLGASTIRDTIRGLWNAALAGGDLPTEPPRSRGLRNRA